MNSTVGVHTDKSNDTFTQLLNVELYMEEGPLVDPAEEMLGEGDLCRSQENPTSDLVISEIVPTSTP